MKRAGFTLIEIMIVVGIIAIMLASAVMSVASGRGAVRVKEATRGVIQLSRYASALALLRQRPVVITFHKKGKIDVRISGEVAGADDIGTPSDPIYREVDGKTTVTAQEIMDAAQEVADEKKESGTGALTEKEKKSFFYTRQVLDPTVLAQEDAEGEYDGVTFTVEVLGDDGEPLDPTVAASRSLPRPKRDKKMDKSDAALYIDGVRIDEEDEQSEEPADMVSVTYEPNGNVNPHRIIVRLDGESDAEEGFVISISRSGKATVGEDDEKGGGRVKRRRRR
jgi:prepilin-type N-terminal cleavage/methylation domain-containing protein